MAWSSSSRLLQRYVLNGCSKEPRYDFRRMVIIKVKKRVCGRIDYVCGSATTNTTTCYLQLLTINSQDPRATRLKINRERIVAKLSIILGPDLLGLPVLLFAAKENAASLLALFTWISHLVEAKLLTGRDGSSSSSSPCRPPQLQCMNDRCRYLLRPSPILP